MDSKYIESAGTGAMIRAVVGILGLQAAVGLGVAVLFFIAGNGLAAKSALIGGAIAFIPGAFYAVRVIRSRYNSPDRLLRAHYAGEFGKLMLTALLFGATFAWVREISVLPLFAAYIATLLVYWAALLMFPRI
jgi:ATP synthase protein I